MELVTVDALSDAPKNGRMTKEQRARIGRKLRALRIERGLDQIDVARDPRLQRAISLGTLQAIEGNWYEVRDSNIEKYAQFFNTSTAKLLKADEPKPVAPTDPLLRDLNEEHLEIARSYMRARKRVRTCIELLLRHPAEEQLTELVLKLDQLPGERLAQLAKVLATDPDGHLADLVERVRRRVTEDAAFMESLRQRLDALERHATPPGTASSEDLRTRLLEDVQRLPAADLAIIASAVQALRASAPHVESHVERPAKRTRRS